MLRQTPSPPPDEPPVRFSLRFRGSVSKARLEEIDVERINVVEKDGTLRIVNLETRRDARPGGERKKTYHGGGGESGGFICFNDEGKRKNGGRSTEATRSRRNLPR